MCCSAIAGKAKLFQRAKERHGLVSMMMMSWAYARAETKILIPVEYTAFAWATLLGWLWFDERVTLATLVGTALIVLGCLRAARQ